MSLFKESIGELYSFGVLQGAIFTFGFGITVPAQTSYGPPPECAAPYQVYATIGFLDFALILGIVAATYLAADVKYQVTAAAGMAGVPEGSKARLRLQMLAAVVLSMVSMGVALTITFYILQVKASTFACWSTATRSFVFGSITFAGLLCALVYSRLVRVAIYSD